MQRVSRSGEKGREEKRTEFCSWFGFVVENALVVMAGIGLECEERMREDLG